jgi:hypothetical protein
MQSFVTRGAPDRSGQTILALAREAYELALQDKLTNAEVKFCVAADNDRVVSQQGSNPQVLIKDLELWQAGTLRGVSGGKVKEGTSASLAENAAAPGRPHRMLTDRTTSRLPYASPGSRRRISNP